jgi:dethiobiotin synthetase
MHFNSLFVAGTDTGVGKTLVTALIALRMRELGINCGVMKPFASGCTWEEGALISEDATFLQQALQLSDTHDEICPIRLEEPLAPLIAARRAGLSTLDWPDMVRDAFQTLSSRYECVVVEGVGGLLAPIWEKNGIGTNRELIEAWELPTVLVARRSLGTINHTLLSLKQPLAAPAHFAGIIFNDSLLVTEDDVAAQTSPDFIAEVVEVPVWGQVPFTGDISPESLKQLAKEIEIWKS